MQFIAGHENAYANIQGDTGYESIGCVSLQPSTEATAGHHQYFPDQWLFRWTLHQRHRRQDDQLAQLQALPGHETAVHGVDVKVAQELLRHPNSRITLDLYTRAVSSEKRATSGKQFGFADGRERFRTVVRTVKLNTAENSLVATLPE